MRHASLSAIACAAAALMVPAGVAAGQAASQAASQAAGQAAVTAADSAALVQAAWAVVARGHGAGRVLWLWAPSAADTARVVPLSGEVRAALTRLGVPASAHRPAGDDTVVVRLTAWRADAGGVLLEVESAWTTVLGTGPRRCRTGSGNHERIRVRRSAAAWAALRDGPVLHGDRVCAPIAGAPT
jgi:hypothetical protein